MKLLDIIRPRFGVISICKAFIGDHRKEDVLDSYDKEGWTHQDANYNFYAKLELEETGVEDAIVRFEYDVDNTLFRIFLNVVFKSEADKRRSHFWVLQDYLSQSEYFDEWPRGKQAWTFRNGINVIHCEESEEELTLEVYNPWESGEGPVSDFNSSVLRTVANLVRKERDDWFDFVKESITKKVILYYCRESEEYPYLWLVVTEEEFKGGSSHFPMHLTKEVLRRIMEQAGWKNAAESQGDNSMDHIILDPITWKPMDLEKWEMTEQAKPMTDEELEKALDEIEYWDRDRTSPPGV